jgi:Zn-dependent protease with chaperone function
MQARHNLLLVAPPLVLMVAQQSFLLLFPGLKDNEALLSVFIVALLATVFVSIPYLLRLLLGLKPLPAGPLRDRLLTTARRLHFRFSDILVWETRNTVANAMVTGPVRWLRYVVLTDRLIKEMTEDEVEAVFGHEVGHIKHHHMLFYFAFMMASLVLLVGVWTTVQKLASDHAPKVVAWFESYKAFGALPLLLLLGSYIFVVFGFLSRRCERQADMFGCRTASFEVFINALEKVALLNGISRDRPGWLSSWQHSTIALRIEFLQRLSADPELEPRVQRTVRLVKWGMVLSLWGMVFCLGALLLAVNPELFKEILTSM